MKDKIVESVIQDLRERSEKGMKEYGVGLDRDDYSLLDWLKEAYTETLDKANYLKAAITNIEKDKQRQLLKEITQADEVDNLYECEEDHSYIGKLLGEGIYKYAKEKKD